MVNVRVLYCGRWIRHDNQDDVTRRYRRFQRTHRAVTSLAWSEMTFSGLPRVPPLVRVRVLHSVKPSKVRRPVFGLGSPTMDDRLSASFKCATALQLEHVPSGSTSLFPVT